MARHTHMLLPAWPLTCIDACVLHSIWNFRSARQAHRTERNRPSSSCRSSASRSRWGEPCLGRGNKRPLLAGTFLLVASPQPQPRPRHRLRPRPRLRPRRLPPSQLLLLHRSQQQTLQRLPGPITPAAAAASSQHKTGTTSTPPQTLPIRHSPFQRGSDSPFLAACAHAC